MSLHLDSVTVTVPDGRDTRTICDQVSLSVEPGEVVAITGASGSGKSTLLNIIGCLDRPTSGRFLLLGKDISRTPNEELARIRREEMGFIFQTFNLIARISVLQNVEIPMMLRGVPRGVRRERAMKLLESINVAHRADFGPQNISGGERQRVAIARALANDPQIIIADEPTGNLDLKNSDEVMKILNQLHEEGRTIIMVTHNPEITENCSRVIRLRDGRILENC